MATNDQNLDPEADRLADQQEAELKRANDMADSFSQREDLVLKAVLDRGRAEKD